MSQEVENVTQDQQKESVISVDTETLQVKPKKKWLKWVISIILIIIAVVAAVKLNNMVDEYRRDRAVNMVKQTIPDGYSKNIGNALEDYFGKRNVIWTTQHAMGSDIYVVCPRCSDKKEIDFGSFFNEEDRYATISNFQAYFSWNSKSNKIEKIDIFAIVNDQVFSSDDRDCTFILNGIFGEMPSLSRGQARLNISGND